MEKLQLWLNEQFNPWKAQMDERAQRQQQDKALLQNKAEELRTMIAMALDGDTRGAVKLWNRAGLEPALLDMRLDMAAEEIALLPAKGEKITVLLDDVLKLVSGDAEATTSPAPTAGF
ncbi:MAG: hypothetical protein WAX89_02780 [Alphaproteobacteria bacterium]